MRISELAASDNMQAPLVPRQRRTSLPSVSLGKQTLRGHAGMHLECRQGIAMCIRHNNGHGFGQSSSNAPAVCAPTHEHMFRLQRVCCGVNVSACLLVYF